nr:CshA/CshB family fibrillar adhesin-related protein [Pedobacter sp. ASV2]
MRRIIIAKLLILGVFFSNTTLAQCFPTQVKTAAFATGGTSVNKSKVLWLTWGSKLDNVENYPYGKDGTDIPNGTGSYASIDVGGGRYLCIQAVISELSGGDIKSYAPGNYSGDSMDEMYNIGGNGHDNKLVSGIRNGANGALVTFTVTCNATLDGVPVKLSGMVIGDAESLSDSEYFNATADGTWNIVELKQDLTNTKPYEVRVVNVDRSTKQRMEFVKGNDKKTAAISFLTFNQTAYIGKSFDVSFTVALKGSGITAIALGLITSGVDGGDAPASYGTPLHLVNLGSISSDGITPGLANGPTTNLNASSYNPGKFIDLLSDYLGSLPPDVDTKNLSSYDAMGDNNDGTAGINEEDAWPAKYKAFSLTDYAPGNTIVATIPYNGKDDSYISGWIDFDQNGIFDDSERVTVSAPANQTSVDLTWIIPANRVNKNTYVRLRYGKSKIDVSSPTGIVTGGEVEDHLIIIQTPMRTNPMLPSKIL